MSEGIVVNPLIISRLICGGNNIALRSKMVGTSIFMVGVSTLLQVLVGTRLPIVQGSSPNMIAAITAMTTLERFRCVAEVTTIMSVGNTTLHESKDTMYDDNWPMRINEISGCLMLASVVQILLGLTGIVGFLMRFIGPLTITPTISLISFTLMPISASLASTHWGVASMTIRHANNKCRWFGGHTSCYYCFNIVESVADYNACAKICQVPPPPAHAVNRGIAIEGLASLVSGSVGACHVTTSYSENIGVIGLTKVGSRMVFIMVGALLLVGGCVGKIGTALALIPEPILGGVSIMTLGLLGAVGLSCIRYAECTSIRNLSILGLAIYGGLMISNWMATHPNTINTGSHKLDQILTVFLSTAMFFGGTIGFILDNLVPGTPEERGILAWRGENIPNKEGQLIKEDERTIYDIPYISGILKRHKVFKRFPFLPSFDTNMQT
ncbi:unnamed protein product [Owenia fusiformis]|uniref:Uncharacterized protein n=1 Tax=Owenia fusiformis TaxID=6347 RepID=A0A8J1TDQ8_OWEFU|nr:unnamed protein product [Owenia fusiformis]